MQTLLNALTGSPGAKSRRTWRVRYLLDPELDEALQNAAEPKAHESKAERQKRMARRLSASLTKGQWFCEACDCWHEKPTTGRPRVRTSTSARTRTRSTRSNVAWPMPSGSGAKSPTGNYSILHSTSNSVAGGLRSETATA